MIDPVSLSALAMSLLTALFVCYRELTVPEAAPVVYAKWFTN